MIIRFRRLLSLPLNLGRLRLCRPARDHLRRGRVSSVSRRRIRVRLHSRLFLALLRARALSPRLSRAHRAPGFPFSPPRVIRRPSQLIIRNRREYRILRVPRVPIETSRIRQSPRSRVRARRRVPPPRTTPPHTHARGDHRARSSHRIRLGRTNPVVFPSTSDPSARTTATVVPRSGADVFFIACSRARPLRAARRSMSTRRRVVLRRVRHRGHRPARAPVDRSVGRRAPDPLVRGRAVGRAMRVFFHGRARGGVHYDDSWPSVVGLKEMDGRSDVAGPCRHPRGRVPSSIRTVRVGGWDSRPLDAGGGD